MKGTEKFWSKQGGHRVIQFDAHHLSETGPLAIFWKEQRRNCTDLRCCVGIRKATALPSATSQTLCRTVSVRVTLALFFAIMHFQG